MNNWLVGVNLKYILHFVHSLLNFAVVLHKQGNSTSIRFKFIQFLSKNTICQANYVVYIDTILFLGKKTIIKYNSVFPETI